MFDAYVSSMVSWLDSFQVLIFFRFMSLCSYFDSMPYVYGEKLEAAFLLTSFCTSPEQTEFSVHSFCVSGHWHEHAWWNHLSTAHEQTCHSTERSPTLDAQSARISKQSIKGESHTFQTNWNYNKLVPCTWCQVLINGEKSYRTPQTPRSKISCL